MKRAVAKDIDAYIAGFPDDVQAKLQEIREVIRNASPRAEEGISYGIPVFKLHGQLVYFAGFRKHISVYPAPRGAPEFRKELAQYKGGKGTIQFPLDDPIPLDLIRRIVKFRIKESIKRKEARARKQK